MINQPLATVEKAELNKIPKEEIAHWSKPERQSVVNGFLQPTLCRNRMQISIGDAILKEALFLGEHVDGLASGVFVVFVREESEVI